jgi:hypothetical protein
MNLGFDRKEVVQRVCRDRSPALAWPERAAENQIEF